MDLVKNRKILCYVSFANIFCILLIWHSYNLLTLKSSSIYESSITELKVEPEPIEPSDESVVEDNFRKNIFFLKSHKTASSTVQNILMRFGIEHSLNFLIPKQANYLGYTAAIDDSELDEELKPPDGKYNMFVHHSRYQLSTNKYLYNDTVRLTILRSPAELFESVYHFFKLDSYYGMTIQELLKSLPRTNISYARHKKLKNGYNQMSYDLGMDKSIFENEKEIRKYVKFLDGQFDLVMIMEYLDASMVLLADLMGWPLRYVAYLPLMQREDFTKYKLSIMDKFKLTRLNNADALLYDHFLNKFRDRVVQYGEVKMVENIQKLQKINEKLIERCIQANDYSGYSYTLGYVLKNQDDWICVHATKSELTFTDEIRDWQKKRLQPIKKLYRFLHGNEKN